MNLLRKECLSSPLVRMTIFFFTNQRKPLLTPRSSFEYRLIGGRIRNFTLFPFVDFPIPKAAVLNRNP